MGAFPPVQDRLFLCANLFHVFAFPGQCIFILFRFVYFVLGRGRGVVGATLARAHSVVAFDVGLNVHRRTQINNAQLTPMHCSAIVQLL